METFLSILIGFGLSAACGFRVFIPFVVAGLAVRTGHLKFASGFAWMGSDAALLAFSIAAIIEVTAYYIPWLDHLLDIAATPTAIVAGIILSASTITELSPLLQWTLALMAGGLAAGTVQSASVMGRVFSTTTTGGLGNPVLATIEMGGAAGVSVLAIALPIGLCFLAIAGGAFAWRIWKRPHSARAVRTP